jgi:hypothetical protein
MALCLTPKIRQFRDDFSRIPFRSCRLRRLVRRSLGEGGYANTAVRRHADTGGDLAVAMPHNVTG